MYSGLSLSLAVAAVFLPTIVGTLGYHSVKANLMTAPVYATAYITLLCTAWLSDRLRLRGLPIMVGGILSGVGYILLGVLRVESARYAVCFLAITVRFPINFPHHICFTNRQAGDIHGLPNRTNLDYLHLRRRH